MYNVDLIWNVAEHMYLQAPCTSFFFYCVVWQFYISLYIMITVIMIIITLLRTCTMFFVCCFGFQLWHTSVLRCESNSSATASGRDVQDIPPWL